MPGSSIVRITRLSLTNFRNYRSLELRLPPHLVVIQGGNAQGKTNLLEAIYVLATTRSHRASSDRDLVHHLAIQESPSFSRLSAEVQRAAGDVKIEIILRLEATGPPAEEAIAAPASIPVRKRIKVNDVARRAIDAVGQLKVVMFSAQDIDLISGSPVLCRRYIDLINCQTDSRYLRCLQRYHRVLLQRNHLLRLLQERQAQPEQLEFWDKELVENGSYIVVRRRQLVTKLDGLAREIHQELSGGTERQELVYVPNTSDAENAAEIEAHFRKALHKNRGREIAQGVTLVGPHRDTLRFRANGTDMSRYGSRGQQQTLALSLKLAEAKYIYSQAGDAPVLLLDDIFSELDRSRRQHLLEAILSFQQVLIAAVDLDYFGSSFLSQATQLRVRGGTIEPV
jgi:DNA replication and repair protein RecF